MAMVILISIVRAGAAAQEDVIEVMLAKGMGVPLTLRVAVPLAMAMLLTAPLTGFPEASVPVTVLPNMLEAVAMLCSRATDPSVLLSVVFVWISSI